MAHKTQNIYYLALYRKSVLTPITEGIWKSRSGAEEETGFLSTVLEDDSGRRETNYPPLLMRPELEKVN